MGILVTTDGEEIIVRPEKSEVFTLEELQALVGGYIEVVPQRVHPDKVYLCDEEGILKSKDINFSVTETIGFGVVGDIVIISHEERE